jgi:hypothetical protein
MRFMMLMMMYPDGNAENGVLPNQEMIDAMTKFNDEMVKAGIVISQEGLYPTTEGARVMFARDSQPVVVDGPFAEAKEIIGGYWMLKVKSKEEAISWAKRIPGDGNSDPKGFVELRRVYEMEDLMVDMKEQQG